jgi:alcohol dehydrogenase class IV
MRIRPFSVAPSGPVVFGPGAASKAGQQGPLKKAARVLVITDAGVRAAGLVDRVLPSLGERAVLIDDAVVPDADVEHIDGLAGRARAAGVDAILALGGGSVIDTAKCVAAVLAKEQDIRALEGIATIRKQLLPVVGVPTTAGTGSEATQFAVVKDRQAGRKRVYMDLSLIPAQSILDPELILGLPPAVTAATAVDAISHAVEALGSRMANPIAAALAVEAVRILVGSDGEPGALKRSLDAPADIEARGACLLAAHLAGQAISSAMLGACHAFAHALGALKGVPHGVANGLFLVPVMRLNQEKARPAYAQLGSALGSPLGGTGELSARAAFAIDAIADVVHGVAAIPSALRSVGVTEADIDALTALTLADADLATNPIALDEEGVRHLIAARL